MCAEESNWSFCDVRSLLKNMQGRVFIVYMFCLFVFLSSLAITCSLLPFSCLFCFYQRWIWLLACERTPEQCFTTFASWAQAWLRALECEALVPICLHPPSHLARQELSFPLFRFVSLSVILYSVHLLLSNFNVIISGGFKIIMFTIT